MKKIKKGTSSESPCKKHRECKNKEKQKPPVLKGKEA